MGEAGCSEAGIEPTAAMLGRRKLNLTHTDERRCPHTACIALWISYEWLAVRQTFSGLHMAGHLLSNPALPGSRALLGGHIEIGTVSPDGYSCLVPTCGQLCA